MNLIVVTDIFGKTEALNELILTLSVNYESFEIIDPYCGIEQTFIDEKMAYRYFTENAGLENYIKKLSSHLDNKNRKKSVIIGFSVGATAIWAVSQSLNKNIIKKAVCFYSSQIRNFTHINPKFPVDIYFAREELRYNVDKMIIKLSEKDMVKCLKTDYLHGFMNKYSHNFDLKGYFEYIETIKKSKII